MGVDSGDRRDPLDLAGRLAKARDSRSVSATQGRRGPWHVFAGVIAAIDGNGIGTRGVAGRTTVLPIRVTTTAP